MTQFTTMLDQESGIQFGGVKQIGDEAPVNHVNGLIVGYFRRGRFDKPMTITEDNIRGVLGHDARNPYYRMVQDALNEGVDSVQVLRLPEAGEVPKPVIPSPPKDEHELKVFDYAVVRYIWLPEGGMDLDTRTLITDPPRFVAVGWNRSTYDEDYLHWVGDNTGDGVESVLLNINTLKRDYPNQNIFTVNFKAFWFSSMNSGHFTLQVETYKGGHMVTEGYDYKNVGGQSVQNMTMDCRVEGKDDTEDYEGFLVAQLSLDLQRKTGGLVKKTDQPTPEQKTITLADSSGITIFNSPLRELRLINMNSGILYDGASAAGSLILRNSINTIIYE